MTATSKLPSYKRPPVLETVLGVEFAPLDKWTIPHFGLFWATVRDSLPKFDIRSTLASDLEQLDTPHSLGPAIAQIQFSQVPDVRCWYQTDDERQIIQVQRDRFVSNWRKLSPEETYPRYEIATRPAFERYWKTFLAFLSQEGLGEPSVVQCEVRYVNHIPKSDGWEEIPDWKDVFTVFGGTPKLEFLPSPEAARFGLNYLMPERKGRLRVTAHSGIRHTDGQDVIALTMLAHGKPNSSSLQDIVSWFDLGREWIVRGFTEITTDKMHRAWERES